MIRLILLGCLLALVTVLTAVQPGVAQDAEPGDDGEAAARTPGATSSAAATGAVPDVGAGDTQPQAPAQLPPPALRPAPALPPSQPGVESPGPTPQPEAAGAETPPPAATVTGSLTSPSAAEPASESGAEQIGGETNAAQDPTNEAPVLPQQVAHENTPRGATSAPPSAQAPASTPVIRSPAAPETKYEVLPIAVPSTSGGMTDLVPSTPSWLQGNVLKSLGLLLLFLSAAWVLRRTRLALPRTGWIPNLVLLLAFLARVGTVAAALWFAAGVLEPVARGAYPWLLAAVALAIGWSLRDVLPDVAAAVVIRLENRLRPGVWIASEHYEGVIERRAARALWIRDPRGDQLAIPNRNVLNTSLRIQAGLGAVHDVALRLPEAAVPEHTRTAILEAVLTSPYVAPEANAAIRRDGEHPTVWRVRARLLHERYAIMFEGQLSERVEAVLAMVPPDPQD